ncbi:MAG: signal peptide peptidase SppA [Rhodobacteraceae bacterium]|nr:signal peptide peptidase SppA [Paracoccaceae bacterium]
MPPWDGNKEGLERDLYEERRRKWRRSGFWRGIGFMVLLLGGITWWALSNAESEFPTGEHIARISINGIITQDRYREEVLAKIAADDDVKALIVWINSPGGTVVGSEILYENLRAVAAEKPVVAQMAGVAASGGYIAAIGADYIVARSNTITGSVGVIMEYPDMSGLLSQIGVEMQVVRSSEIKGGVSPFREASPEEVVAQEALITETFQWFKNLVAERRNLSGTALDDVTTGGVFSGRTAMHNGLIDALGGEAELRVYLESVTPTLSDLHVEDWELSRAQPWFDGILSTLLGINPLLERFSASESLALYSITR